VRLKQQQPPWRVIRAFPGGAGEALAHLHNVSGGVLDNDDLRLQVEVGPDARAQLTTTGATRIYRSRSAGSKARQQTDLTIAARGRRTGSYRTIRCRAQSAKSSRCRPAGALPLLLYVLYLPGRPPKAELARS